MLMPKKVKHRKVQRGRMRGKAWKGHTVAFGDYGLKVTEPGWITDRQIEAARVANLSELIQLARLLLDASVKNILLEVADFVLQLLDPQLPYFVDLHDQPSSNRVTNLVGSGSLCPAKRIASRACSSVTPSIS